MGGGRMRQGEVLMSTKVTRHWMVLEKPKNQPPRLKDLCVNVGGLLIRCHLANGSSRYLVPTLPRWNLPIARLESIPTGECWNEGYNRILLN